MENPSESSALPLIGSFDVFMLNYFVNHLLMKRSQPHLNNRIVNCINTLPNYCFFLHAALH